MSNRTKGVHLLFVVEETHLSYYLNVAFDCSLTHSTFSQSIDLQLCCSFLEFWGEAMVSFVWQQQHRVDCMGLRWV